jgi:hypothetical protein
MAHALNLAAQAVLKIIEADDEPIVEKDLSEDETWEEDTELYAADSEDASEPLGDAAVAAIFRVVRKITAKIRTSNVLWEALKVQLTAKGLDILRPLLDVRTRWNSTYDMIERLTVLRPAIDNICLTESSLTKFNLNLDEHDWVWLIELMDVLAIFKGPTLIVSGERYPTLSHQLPQYWAIATLLQEKVQRFQPGSEHSNAVLYQACTAGYRKLNEYHLYTDQVTAPRIATMLDPRFKLTTLEDLGWKAADLRKARTALEKVILHDYFPPGGRDLEAASQSSEDLSQRSQKDRDRPSPQFQPPMSRQDALMYASEEEVRESGFLSSGNAKSMRLGDRAMWKAELDRYLAEPRIDKDADILAWWDQNAVRLPHLYKVAQDYIAIPGSSVPSERVFSKAGDLVSKKRNRLAPNTAEQVMSLRYWLGLPEASEEEKEAFNEFDGNEDAFQVEHFAVGGDSLPDDEELIL